MTSLEPEISHDLWTKVLAIQMHCLVASYVHLLARCCLSPDCLLLEVDQGAFPPGLLLAIADLISHLVVCILEDDAAALIR